MKAKADVPFAPLNIAVLTVSDTRTLETDTSGQVFVDRLGAAGHHLAARVLLKDDLYKIRAQVATWIADDVVQVVLITGGTGFTGRDSTRKPSVACWTSRSTASASCFARYRWRTSAPRRCNPARWPAWPMAPWCAACRAPLTRYALAGMESWPSSWTSVTGRATLSPI